MSLQPAEVQMCMRAVRWRAVCGSVNTLRPVKARRSEGDRALWCTVRAGGLLVREVAHHG